MPNEDFGRWQGARWRVLCRFTAAFAIGLPLVVGFASSSPTPAQGLTGVGIAVVVLGLCEYLFARRIGFEIQPDRLVLCGLIRRVDIPWRNVQEILWRRKPSLSHTQYLYLKTDQENPRRFPRDAPVRVPTVAFVAKSPLPNDRLLGSFLTSPNVRTNDGREVDVVDLLEQARRRSYQHVSDP